MRKLMAIAYLVIGCLLVGIVIASFFQGKSNQQPGNWSARKLTEEERAEVIKIALDDTKVKEMLKGKEYKISGAGMWLEENRTGPVVMIYAGEDNWTKITMIDVLVDLDKKNVVDIVERPIEPVILKGAIERREEAIGIALDSEIVKEKIEGLEYHIKEVYAFENLKTGEKGMRVYIHINETNVCYGVNVNLTERRVTEIGQSDRGIDKIGTEKSAKAMDIALDDPRVKEKMEGKQCIVTARQKLIGKKLLVDVYIEMEEPPMTYIATVDWEEGKVIKITETASWVPMPGR
ncbi:MAG TPA: hypothetical protein ENN68_03385 [Methanomicrobia archaeon]|nr:hypothetical protein [Methanomicrobia archaeon]